MVNVFGTSLHPGGANAIWNPLEKLISDEKVNVSILGYKFSEKIFSENKLSYSTIEDYGEDNIDQDSLERILKKISPDLILTGTSGLDEKGNPSIEHLCAMYGKDNGIPTVAVLDAWMNYSQRFSGKNSEEKFFYLPDFVAIMDNYAKNQMLEEGFLEKNLVVTGNPYHANLLLEAENFSDSKKEELKKSIGLQRELLYYYAGSGLKETESVLGKDSDLRILKLINTAYEGLEKSLQEKIGVVVNLHPRYDEERKKSISDYLLKNPNFKLVEGIDSKQLILASSGVFSNISTLLFDAIIMNKSAVSLQPGRVEDKNYLKSYEGIVPFAFTEESVLDAVKTVMLGKNNKSSGINVDPNATKNVVNLIYKILDI